ncbi:hypothetical protein XENOCAPTIV_009671 [Xenoophorus captivus]|uniref:Uncharacterized protein n=1 Tax=Xenoophorus captivus TaxID=1517983 RepID=A0ABV0Q9Z4_9TELE
MRENETSRTETTDRSCRERRKCRITTIRKLLGRNTVIKRRQKQERKSDHPFISMADRLWHDDCSKIRFSYCISMKVSVFSAKRFFTRRCFNKICFVIPKT